MLNAVTQPFVNAASIRTGQKPAQPSQRALFRRRKQGGRKVIKKISLAQVGIDGRVADIQRVGRVAKGVRNPESV